LRTRLLSLYADHLRAARLVGTLDGLREVCVRLGERRTPQLDDALDHADAVLVDRTQDIGTLDWYWAPLLPGTNVFLGGRQWLMRQRKYPTMWK